MKFVKWRTMWAWGYSPSAKGPAQGWNWEIFPANAKPRDIRATMEAIGEEEGGHSDKYRCIEWKTVKNPPLSVVSAKYSKALDDLEAVNKRVIELQLLRDQLLQLTQRAKVS